MAAATGLVDSGNVDAASLGGIGGVQRRDHRVQGVVGATHPDEDEFFTVGANGALGQGALEDQRDVGDGGHAEANAS